MGTVTFAALYNQQNYREEVRANLLSPRSAP